MTDLRQAAQQALEALGSGNPYHQQLAAKVLRTALEQQAEPVSQAVIVGALFDFMGWLTTRKDQLVLSSVDNASPAADAIKVFAEMRGLSLDDARVQDWQNYTTQQQAEPTCPDCKAAVLYECVACSSNNYPPKQQAEPPQRPWVGLTDDEMSDTVADMDVDFGDLLWKVVCLTKIIEAKLKERNT